jgi:hypothetical protein
MDLLRDLMSLDKEYFRMKKRLEEIPVELERIEEHDASLRQALLAEEARLSQCQRERRKLEMEIQDRQEAKRRFERQVYEVRDNREFQSLQREIEFTRQRLGELEEQVVGLMEEEERLEKEIGALRADTASKQRDLEERRQALAREREELTAALEEMSQKRQALVSGLRAAIRSKYERIVAAKGREAIVEVVDGSCGGCFYKLPPQTFAEVRMGHRLILCEGCGRILVWMNNA